MLDKTQLLQLLADQGISYVLEEHHAVLNMGDSGKLALALQGSRCKNLLLQDRKGNCFLVMTTATKSLDLVAVAAVLESRRLSFASAEMLFDVLGLRPGSLSPLALVNDEGHRVRLIIDTELAGEQAFLLHPLENTATLALTAGALEKFLAGIGHPPSWLALAARP